MVSLYQRRDRESLVALQEIRPSGTFYLYAPEDDPKGFDSSLVVILCMACSTLPFLWIRYDNILEAVHESFEGVGLKLANLLRKACNCRQSCTWPNFEAFRLLE